MSKLHKFTVSETVVNSEGQAVVIDWQKTPADEFQTAQTVMRLLAQANDKPAPGETGRYAPPRTLAITIETVAQVGP